MTGSAKKAPARKAPAKKKPAAGRTTPRKRAAAPALAPVPDAVAEQARQVIDRNTPKRLSLVEARAARDAKRGKPPELEVTEGVFLPLPMEMAAEILDLLPELAKLEAMADDDENLDLEALDKIDEILNLVTGDQMDEIRRITREAGRPLSIEDLFFLVESAFEIYDVPLPESSASASS